MKLKQFGAYAGILFPILLFPLSIISTDFARNQTVSDSVYVKTLIDHNHSIQYATGIGLLSLILLLIHLEWLTDVVSQHAPLPARVARSTAQLAVIGVALTFGLTGLAAYGADQKWPDQAVRTTGLLGANVVGMFFVGLGAFAGVIAVLGWKGKFPKWIAFIASLELLIAVVATGVGAPGVAILPTIFWLLANAIGMLFHKRKNP